MGKKKTSRTPVGSVDSALHTALRKAYTERARLFVRGIAERGVGRILNHLNGLDADSLDWSDSKSIGIAASAKANVEEAGVALHLAFCHPDIITAKPDCLEYYRNLAALSKKGLNQMTSGLRGKQKSEAKIRAINEVLSGLIADMVAFDLALAQAVIPAEIGAELQGTWVNVIGRGAATRVEELITDYIKEHDLAKSRETFQETIGKKKRTKSRIILKNQWEIIFGDEPDVEIRNSKGTLRVAIEIKGSMDKAGAQTRYGEAKKSFAKALGEHAQCETIYLASCFTDAVFEQIQRDAQVRKVFNLIDVLADDSKRQEFLDELFKHLIRI